MPIRLFLIALVAVIGLLPVLPAQAQTAASFRAPELVTPLNPVAVEISLPNYSGSAELVVFDSAGRAVGAYPLSVSAGRGSVVVTPRGSLGAHWAALFANGRQVANGTLYRLDAETQIRTGVPAFDTLYDRVRTFMAADRLSYELNGRVVNGYRSPDSPLIWLRDHYYQNRAFRYFEQDLRSVLDAFRAAQYPDGSFPDFLARPQWNIPAFRTPVEADVEYLFVQWVYETWQTTGDLNVVRENLAAMQKAIAYSTNDPLRWNRQLGLIVRPFTVDTWDYEYGPTTISPLTGEPSPRHWIDEQTKWGVFHGDNTGLAEALRSLATMERQFGLWEQAYERDALAAQVMERLNNLSWNGRFYTHHVKLVPYDVPGVDEAEQLSLSNAIALNRGVLSEQQGRAIIAEYLRRLRDPNRIAFAEWWSIDPPFPPGAFGLAGRVGERPGEYVNGGVMPLVGGELARGAFRYGYEEYGFDILDRYASLIARTGATYLWYYPTGGVAADTREFLATDGWGSSAMFGALIEGGAGIVDRGIAYDQVTLSPRWLASPRAEINEAYAVARYAASNGYAAYRWSHRAPEGRQAGQLSLEATSSGNNLQLRILLPSELQRLGRVLLNGQAVQPRREQIGTSEYLVLEANGPIVNVLVEYR